MTQNSDDRERFIDRVREHEQEVKRLKSLLASQAPSQSEPASGSDSACAPKRRWPLKQEEYERYGRQLILPEVGINGQVNLRNARVLIVGIGGLGCPAASYLAGAGIGTIGLMDGDTVDISNLHRQVLHSTETVGMLKVESAELSLKRLNPLVRYKLHRHHLEPKTAVAAFRQYDLVLDCTDHPTSRYLVSDTAVCAGIPLISGAALRTDGQLYVLNYPTFNAEAGPGYVSGPCYRCVHPKPPPADSMVSCAEGGILGPVVGTIGVLMATEAIKILTSNMQSQVRTLTTDNSRPPTPSMLMYSAYASPPFRSVRLRGRRVSCPACSPDSTLRTISTISLSSGAVDYVAFCGHLSSTQMLGPEERMEPQELARAREALSNKRTLLLDVRNDTEFEICSLPGSMHVPLPEVKQNASEIAARVAKDDVSSVVAVCRFGNDSQVAAKILQEEFHGSGKSPWIGDLRGGLAAWTKDVDSDFPNY